MLASSSPPGAITKNEKTRKTSTLSLSFLPQLTWPVTPVISAILRLFPASS